MTRQFSATLLLLYLSGCGGHTVQSEESVDDWHQDPRPVGRTLVYECPGDGGPGYEFIARLGPGEMAVWLDDRYVVLSQVRAASGVKYVEGDITFWMKGEEAMLTMGAVEQRNCRLNHARVPWEDARRRGVNFRAVGNEPGWHLEIQQGRQILFVGDYGMERVVVPDPGEERDGPTRIYQASGDGHELRVEVVDEICTDTMKGDSFPSRVTLRLDGTTYWGCGRDLNSPWQ